MSVTVSRLPQQPAEGAVVKRRFFYGWVIVAGGAIFQALNNGLMSQAFGVYFVQLQQEYGWSRTLLSGAYSLNQVSTGLLSPVQGWLIERMGSRAVLRIGALTMGISLMALSWVSSSAAFYGVFLFAALGASFSGFLPVSAALANWFRAKRAMSLSLTSLGAGFGGFLVVLLAWMVGAYGWRETAFISGVFVIVVGLPAAQLVRDAPEPYGYLPDGVEPSRAFAGGTPVVTPAAPGARLGEEVDDFTVGEALRTRAFWLIGIGHAAALLAIVAGMVHLIPDLVDRIGLTGQSAAYVVSVITVAMMVGMVVGAFTGDRFDKRVITVVMTLGQALALFILAFATSMELVLVFAVLHGFCWGIRGPLMSAMRADYFGRKHFPAIMGASMALLTTGSVTAPLFAGYMADRFGNYRAGFMVLATLTALGSVCFLFARKPVRRPATRPS